MSTMNRLEEEQPEKLMVTFPEAEPLGVMVPTVSGKAAGLVITGVQAGPAVGVRVRPVICAARAWPGPLFCNVIVQTRAG